MNFSNVRRNLHRLVAALRPRHAETDLAREIAAHLQMLEDEFVAKGMTREDARVGQVAITVIFVASLVSLGWNLFANPTVTQSYASRVPDIGSR